MSRFKDQRVLVTGASAGIGMAVAKGLAEEGAQVFAVARREEKLKELFADFPNVTPVALDIRGDLSKLDPICAEGIDILVNNAGLARGRESIETTSLESIDELLETNVRALILVTQKVLPKMLERKRGDVVNLGSIAGYETYPHGSIYNATKFAVRALTEAWRKDFLGKGIRVHGIHPGMVESEFSLVRFYGDEQKAKAVYKGMQPLTPEDVAESIIWSLSLPRHVSVHSLVLMPTDQAGVANVLGR